MVCGAGREGVGLGLLTGVHLRGVAAHIELEPVVELALGLDPRATDAPGAFIATIETNDDDSAPYLTIRHRRLLTPGALSYRLEISSDLIEWHVVTSAESEEVAPPSPNVDGLTETVAIRLKPAIGTPGLEARHVRLRVSTNSGGS